MIIDRQVWFVRKVEVLITNLIRIRSGYSVLTVINSKNFLRRPAVSKNRTDWRLIATDIKRNRVEVRERFKQLKTGSDFAKKITSWFNDVARVARD